MSNLPSFVIPRMRAVIAHLTERGNNKILLHGGYDTNYQRRSQVDQEEKSTFSRGLKYQKHFTDFYRSFPVEYLFSFRIPLKTGGI